MSEVSSRIAQIREDSKALSLCNAFVMSNPLDRDLKETAWNLSSGKLQVMKEKGVHVYSITQRDGTSRVVNLFEIQNQLFRELLSLFRPENLRQIEEDSNKTSKLRTQLEQELKVAEGYKQQCISEQKSAETAKKKAEARESQAYGMMRRAETKEENALRLTKLSTKTYWILTVITCILAGALLTGLSSLFLSDFVWLHGGTDTDFKMFWEYTKEYDVSVDFVRWPVVVIANIGIVAVIMICYYFLNPWKSFSYRE